MFYPVEDKRRSDFFDQLQSKQPLLDGTMMCPTWDPQALNAINDPKHMEQGFSLYGRDGRLWQVHNGQWVLSPSNAPLQRPTRGSGGDGVPLATVDWWKWSTMRSIEHFRVVDCGGGGDCLFRSIGKSLGFPQEDIRILAASGLTELPAFLESEKLLRREGGHYSWRIEDVHTLHQMQEIIRTSGNLYWGDTSTLDLLCQTPMLRRGHIGFVIFRTDGVVDPRLFAAGPEYEVTHLCLLYNDSNHHWKLVSCDGFLLCPRHLPAVESVLKSSWAKEYDRTFRF